MYWRARMPSQRLLRRLPAHFVIRPIGGTARRGVFVVANGRELLRNAPFAGADVRRSILRGGKMAWTQPVLAEEFVRTESGEYRFPVEYKCHTFGDVVAAVQVMARNGMRADGHRFYTADWRPFADPMNTDLPQMAPGDPPRCLDEMLALATRLGAALGTYMRIDFFASDCGCVFNEFSSAPMGGHYYTPLCDELFGALWEEKFPDAS